MLYVASGLIVWGTTMVMLPLNLVGHFIINSHYERRSNYTRKSKDLWEMCPDIIRE